MDRIDDYRAALEDYSQRLLPLVQWEPTEHGNVRVLNDTGDYYRYFDATPQTEFLYGSVQRTIELDLPQEAEFLRRYDAFRNHLNLIVDMPDRLSDLLFRFLHQNAGYAFSAQEEHRIRCADRRRGRAYRSHLSRRIRRRPLLNANRTRLARGSAGAVPEVPRAPHRLPPDSRAFLLAARK